MTTATHLLTKLGIRLPIIQAPMAGVSTPALAAAVSNAGALGSIGIGASNVTKARDEIEATRHLTTQPFNVNVFCHQPAQCNIQQETDWLKHLAPLYAEVKIAPPTTLNAIYQSFLDNDAIFELLLEQRPAIASFHFGLPTIEQIQSLRQAGIFTMATATNPLEAQQIEAAGIDAIVAQGIEAGGHRGMFDPESNDQQLSTSVLVRTLAQQSQLPIIAAGGIMDGHGIKAALKLGASAAQLGTAFILCPETSANANYRDNLKNSQRNSNTRLTKTLSGRPARGLVNRFIHHCESADSPTPAPYPFAYDAAKQLNAAATQQGNCEFSAQWAGQGAPLIRELTTQQLIETLEQELQ